MRARSATAADAELLASAVALRWSRPDLTAAIAEHVAITWAADNRTWVAAAGWLVHGRAAVGDGRECASDTLAELVRRDPALLDDPAADRLRIEVATLASAYCEPAVARLLVEPLGHDRRAEVQADALGVLARCAFEDRPATVGEATRRAKAAWASVRSGEAEIAVAALTLLSATAARRAGHPEAAVDHAAEGLARLDDLRRGASAPYLATALAAEWITALIEAGRTDDARTGSETMTQRHLGPTARPTRQTALLRLTVARALAASNSAGAFEALERAAADASQCDTPDLEGLCLSTLGTLREQAGRLDAALESMRRGVAAQRRDRARSERFRAALRALPLGSPGSLNLADSPGRPGPAAPTARPRPRPRPIAERAGPPHPLGPSGPWMSGRWAIEEARSEGWRPGRTEAVSVPQHGTAVDVRAVEAAPAGGGTSASPHLADAVPSHREMTVDAAFDPLFGPLDWIVDRDVDEGAHPATNEVTATTEVTPSSAPFGAASGQTQAPTPDDRDSWLTRALAELDRAWRAPLPDLRSVAGPPGTAEEAAVDAASPSGPDGRDGDRAPGRGAADDRAAPAGSGGAGLDEQATSPWASWTEGPDARRMVKGSPGSDRAGAHRRDGKDLSHGRRAAGHPTAPRDLANAPDTSGREAEPGPDAVGCVVVVDLVCAGAPVAAGATLLRAVQQLLADSIPAGGRLRLDDSTAVLSVLMPGHDRAFAADWMHRTLPAVFRDAPDPGDPVLPVGTALRATLHDTDGPVGAQLLQRLDHARRRDASSVPVRWGVPIAPGSGGRRRRPDDGGPGSGGAAHPARRSRPVDGRSDRPRADATATAGGAGEPSGFAAAHGARESGGCATGEDARAPGALAAADGAGEAGGSAGLGGAREAGGFPMPGGAGEVGGSAGPGGAREPRGFPMPGGVGEVGGSAGPGGAREAGGFATADAAGEAAGCGQLGRGPGAGDRADVAVLASSTGDDHPGPAALVPGYEGAGEPTGTRATEAAGSRAGAVDVEPGFSVEGLGLADLLAGALAAYRAI